MGTERKVAVISARIASRLRRSHAPPSSGRRYRRERRARRHRSTVNNAGVFIAKRFTQYTEADYAIPAD
jgi:hypothetical protein